MTAVATLRIARQLRITRRRVTLRWSPPGRGLVAPPSAITDCLRYAVRVPIIGVDYRAVQDIGWEFDVSSLDVLASGAQNCIQFLHAPATTPARRSGAMYAGVPMTVPVLVSGAE